MVFAFKNSTDVLHFKLNSWPHKTGKRKYLLWPAYAFQVVAPEPHQRQLNILQKHVLNFCESGINKIEKIAELLTIEQDLVAYIFLELQSLAALDDDFLPTRAGRDLLLEEKADNPKMVAGYVFQDPWTGKLWPRFVRQLSFVDVKYDDRNRATLNLGSHGKPWSEHAFRVIPGSNNVCLQPEPEDILKVVRLHRRQYRIWKQQKENVEQKEEKELPDNAAFIQKIGLINEQPIPFWLTTYVYIPKDIKDGACWQICDPFGFGMSRKLRENLEKRMREDEHLRRAIRSISGNAVDEHALNFAEMITRLHAEAAERVEDRLTLAIRDCDELFGFLVDLESAVVEIEILGRDTTPGKIKDVLTKLQTVLEGAFQAIQKQYPTSKCWEGILMKDYQHSGKEHNAEVIREIASQIGFSGEQDNKLPSSMVYVRFGKIKYAADHGNQSINSLVIAALLTAHRCPEHPLHKAAKVFPNMLLKINEISELRNQCGAHAGKQGKMIFYQQIADLVDAVYETVKLLIFK